MKTILRFILAGALALGFVAAVPAQEQAPPPGYEEPPRFSQAELDSMLAPIALYPDSMLSQLLMAATFPRDVAEAAAWSRANREQAGEAAVRAVANMPWDPSVKSLVAFPQVLAMMDEHMEWTERLGDAFMANPSQMSDTIQVLRGRADQAGNLRSSEEMNVQRDYGNYVIEPAQPDVVYVPYYDPRVVYGPWWWPDYAPVYWSPWAGYSWTPGYAFAWGYGVSLGSGFWYSSFDWPRRYVHFSSHRPYYYRGHSRHYGHRWYSDHDHNRNMRGYHYSGYRGNDGRPGGRDGQRYDGQRRDGQRHDGQRRDGQRYDGQRYDGQRRDGQRSEGQRDGRGIGRAPAEQRYTVPSGSRAPEGQPSQPLYRAPVERSQPSQAAPGSQPLSRGAIAAPVSVQPQMQAPRQSLQRVPVPHPVAPPASSPPPAASPVARERHSAPEPRQAPERREASEPRAESRPEPSQRSGGGNSLGRGGGRADRQ